MIIRGRPSWTLFVVFVLCLCVMQVAYAVQVAEVSNVGLSNIFVLDTREPGSNIGYSDIFVLDTREPGSNIGYSSIFVLDTREPGSNVGYSNIFVLNTQVPSSNVGYSNIFTLDTRAGLIVSLPAGEDVPINRVHGVPVSVSDVTGRGYTSLQTVLTYDGSVIHPVGILTVGTMTENWDVEFNIKPGTSPDTMKIAMAAGQETLGGAGVLFVLKVEASPGASVEDSSKVHFESFRFNEYPAGDVDTQDGTVYIVAPVRLLGDVTNNGAVTAYDASWILQHTVELRRLADADSVAADVSGVEGITAYDASLVLRYVIDMIDRFPVEGGGQARLVAFSRTVGIPRVGSTSEGYLTVPIAIDGMEGVLSGELVVSFDPEKVEAMSVVPSALLSAYMTEQNVTDDKVLVSFAGAESGDGSGEVLEVTFRPVGDTVEALRGIRLERVRLNEGSVVVTLTNDGKPDVPTTYALYPNYPNPFNPETTIRYGVPVPGRVVVVVYNLSGQKVRELVSGLRDAGMYTVLWDGRDDRGSEVGSGVYLYRLQAGRHEDIRRMVMVK